ncbi:mechanosensitive ion channel protein MscS [Pontibacter mangrovi]|uniref:Mechanosensitive ion channel protein MscS n=1 Tax=Pontibacter mangrovi TaxID=2589816 RepID=A0A501WAP2_9BACT|nr:mechanosensitive ion channel protein MscS [Pontibacter mangrovi]TPE44271.1 mechanosensitive ion channel protein MscS [Pontibacter mangrovi]
MLKNIFYAVLFGVGMAACLSQQDKKAEESSGSAPPAEATETSEIAPNPSAFVVEKQGVGNIRIGMDITQMREQVPQGFTLNDTTLQLEGMQSTAYVLHPKEQPKGILVEQSCNPDCKVWRISVLSQEFRTAAGISVGSKYGEVQQAYNIRTVTFEEGNLVALAPDAGMSFILDHSSLQPDQLPQLKATTVPENLPVRKILVY